MEMTDLCLDTSAYCALKRGDDEVYIYLERADRILVPTIVLGELRAGFAGGGRRTQNLLELSEFLSLPGCEIAMIDEAVSRRYADIVTALRSNGTPIPTNDIWIAAVALNTASTVLTRDRHFSRVPILPTLP